MNDPTESELRRLKPIQHGLRSLRDQAMFEAGRQDVLRHRPGREVQSGRRLWKAWPLPTTAIAASFITAIVLGPPNDTVRQSTGVLEPDPDASSPSTESMARVTPAVTGASNDKLVSPPDAQHALDEYFARTLGEPGWKSVQPSISESGDTQTRGMLRPSASNEYLNLAKQWENET